MPVYEYKGQFYELSETDPAAAKNKILAHLGGSKAETTVLGQVKEGFKGLIPGAVGLVESAAVGASALLPEDYEKAAREKIASIAGAAKAPFAAAPGYEDSIIRKGSEALGSTVPFLLAGPLGLAGRIGAVGLGVGAGAGEARGRAEQGGATAEQRSTATALGIIPGAMEVFAPFRILSRIPAAAKAQGVQLVKRAALAGGEEAAQEAASGFAQNLIAKGVYKPEQELIEGLGEQAAYGGATGAIVQGLMDLALGRRARAAQPAPGTLPGETPIERAERLKAEAEAAKAAAQPPAPPAAEIPPLPDTYAELVLYSEQLKTLPKSKERDAALKAAAEKRKALIVSDVEEQRSASEAAKGFMTAEEAAAAQITPREEVTAPAEGQAPAPVEEPKVRKVGEPPATGLQPADIEALGISKKQPIYRRMLGKDLENPEQRAEVLADIENYLVRGNGTEESRTKLTEFKAKFAAPPVAETPADVFTEAALDLAERNREGQTPAPVAPPPPAAEAAPVQPETPSVAEPQPEAGGAGVPVAGGPAAVTPTEGVQPQPDGVVPPVTDVAGTTGGKGAEPPAVTPPTPTAAPSPPPPPTPAQPPAPTPAQVERELATLVDSGRITEEQAADYRAELLGEAEEAPTTAMGQAFQKQIDDIKAQMNALRQKSGKPPAPKSKNRAKFDELEAQLNALSPVETGTLKEKLEKAEATGVFEVRDGKPILDIPAVREALKGRDPKMLKAVLTYIGVDEDGDYLPTTYSADEAAQSVGLAKSSGANVRRIAETLGITADVVSRFQAAQTGAIGIAKNVSEASLSGISVENPKAGLLYETGKKGVKAVGFLRPALTETGQLDFSKLDTRQLADIYSRASRYDAKSNTAVMQQLNAEVEARRKADRAGTDTAINRAYGKLVAEEEAQAEEEVETVEEGAEEPEFGDSTRRLSDEDVEYRTIPQSPLVQNRASHAELEKVVADIEKALGGKVAVTILDDVTDVDAKQQPGSRAGAVIKGEIYLFRSGIAKGIEGQKTIFHELFHKGLKKILPEAEYRALMNKFYSQSADIRAMADAYLASDTGKQDTKGLSPQDARALAVEESLAEVAEQTDIKPTLVRQIGNFLARVADRIGMTQLARAIRTMGMNEQEKFVRDAIQAGLGVTEGGGATRFRSITPQTEAAVQDVDVIGEQKEAKPISGNPAIKARIHIANNMAGLFDKFNEWYGGAIRTAGNRLIPTVFISRALDADRVSNEAQLIGGLRKVDELIVASEIRDADGNVVLGADGQPLSYANVLNRIATAAKKAGKSYDEYKKTIDKVLYGHREYNVREKNRLIEQQAAALDAAGKTKEAAKLRENIADLAIKDPKVLDNIETQFQKDDFIKGVSTDFDAIRFDFLDMLVETGRITKEVAQEWKDNVGYAPFNRVQDYEDTFDAESSRVQGVGVVRMRKKFEGSTRQSTSVIDNFSKLLDWATGEAMRNEAKNRALKDMVLMGAAKPRNGKELASDEPGGVVKTFEDGVAKEYLVPDPMLFVGFTMHTPEMNSAIRALNRYGTRVLRAGVTMMPPFAIKQVFDDLTRAYTFAGVKNNAVMVKNILTNFPKNWFNEALGKEVWKTAKGQTSVKDLRRLGIVASYDLSREGNLKNIEVEAKARGESLWNTVLRVMEAGAKASDVSVRQGIYDQVLKETGDKVMAESAAREIINFSYQGANKLVQGIASVVPFFNAYAQGTDKLAVAAAGGVVGMTPGMARSMFYTRMTTLTALGFAYALMMQDDDEYNKLDAHVRDTNWIIPGAKIGGMPAGIPVPADLAFFFKSIPERVVRYFKYSGTDEERAALDVLSELAVRGYDVFSPPNVTPQLLRPFVENLVNYSFFLGRPLESQAQLGMRPFSRSGVGTSDTMKWVAEQLEEVSVATGIDAFAVSPIKLENLMRGLLGTAGGTALSVADWMVNPTRTDRPLHQQLSTQLSGASALLKNPVGNAYMAEIYNLEKKTEQVYNSYNNLLKNKPEKVDEFVKDNIGMYSIRGPVQGVLDSIRSLNAAAQAIDKDTSLSPDERRKRITELQLEQNEIARVVFSLRKLARDIQTGR
jgi:polyhydroxyalkanoate synthesis regulator phasin